MKKSVAIGNFRELEFAVFCIENLSLRLGVDGKCVYDALAGESNILNGYIVPEYEMLHTQDRDYIVDDILELMRERGGETMMLYHGSYVEIPNPDLSYSRSHVDFWRGFYTTPIHEQAVKWCAKFKRRGRRGIVSRYMFDEDAERKLRVLRFDSYSEEWLTFILNCRRGNDALVYDIVAGGVANDKVFNTVELFFDGLIDKGEAIKRLRYEKPNMQICFRTNRALAELRFEGSERI